ncbi:MAG TPA: lipopolysaccharide biosynthesis protein [Ruminococcus sp.]|nr:lipopolysaccharide biosynthesis protein [Ruminococcus sp.]
MEKKNEHYLNVTLKNNEENDEEEVALSLSAFLRALKRFLLIWIVVAIVVGLLIPSYIALFQADQYKNLSAMVSFNYSGIENGKAPDGSEFDVYTLKNPAVVQEALLEMGEDLDELETIRQGISIQGVVPENIIDKMTGYISIFEQGSTKALEEILATSYYSTQYVLTFNYSKTSFKGEKAVELFNTILEKYRSYFFKTYGFNEALGSAVTAIDYKNYDYSEAIDVFDSTLSSLQDYVNNLSKTDTTRFRSSQTGYTFADLSRAITTIREVNLDLLSSYVTVNNVTKDANALMDYYNYRIDVLTRDRNVQQEYLQAVTDALDMYEKDTVFVMNGSDSTSSNMQFSQSSDEYDKLVNEKVDAQKTVATRTQQINNYQKRILALKGKSVASQDKITKTEADLEDLNTQVNDLLEKVNVTSDEYYQTVFLSNSYRILVQASSSGLHSTKNIIKLAVQPVVIGEALIFVLYFGGCFVLSLIEETRKRKLIKQEEKRAKEQEKESDYRRNFPAPASDVFDPANP